MSFSSLQLDSTLVDILNRCGYEAPTDIQQQAVPEILAGRDVIAAAQTGTGKTAAFALPIIQNLCRQIAGISDSPRVLVLTPTRELTQQVYNSFVKYAKNSETRIAQAYGGASIKPQAAKIKAGIDVLVATPGRLLDLLYNDLLTLDSIQVLVLDEADRMLDLGFKAEISKILKRLPDPVVQARQTLLFSATLDDSTFKLAKQYLSEPVIIEVAPRNVTADTVEQLVYNVDPDKKRGLCAYLIGSKNWQQVLIFTRTKKSADELTKELCKDGLSAMVIHGDKSQGHREKALAQFKAGDCRVLVATDVAARGLDIKQLQYVINYELPYNAEDYVHRIGRTGRAGESGLAVTLVSEEELPLLKAIETLLNRPLLQQWFVGFEPDLDRVIRHAGRSNESGDQRAGKGRRGGMSKKRARQQALAGYRKIKKR